MMELAKHMMDRDLDFLTLPTKHAHQVFAKLLERLRPVTISMPMEVVQLIVQNIKITITRTPLVLQCFYVPLNKTT
jgi:hypothetical protein